MRASVTPGPRTARRSASPRPVVADARTTSAPRHTASTEGSMLGVLRRSALVRITSGAAPLAQTAVSSRSSRRGLALSTAAQMPTRSMFAAITWAALRPPASARASSLRRGSTSSIRQSAGSSPLTRTQSPVTGVGSRLRVRAWRTSSSVPSCPCQAPRPCWTMRAGRWPGLSGSAAASWRRQPRSDREETGAAFEGEVKAGSGAAGVGGDGPGSRPVPLEPDRAGSGHADTEAESGHSRAPFHVVIPTV